MLHERIALRFDAMLDTGFLDEVRRLRSRSRACTRTCPRSARSATGRPGRILDGAPTPPTFREQAIAATRQLAKRQLTWLRGEHDARWFDPAIDGGELDAALRMFVTRR